MDSSISFQDGATVDEVYQADLREIETSGLVDISAQAHWSATSEKPGSSVHNMIDDSPHTFWQSDAVLPHQLMIRFSKWVSLVQVSLFVSCALDESYTPKTVALYAGTGPHDLIICGKWDLDEPNGWCHFSLRGARKDGTLRCFVLRLVISSNHQNGKDSHIRAIKLFAQRPPHGGDIR